MHNINSNQLAEWKHSEFKHNIDKVDDYYNCMIDAEETHSDKRICLELLNQANHNPRKGVFICDEILLHMIDI